MSPGRGTFRVALDPFVGETATEIRFRLAGARNDGWWMIDQVEILGRGCPSSLTAPQGSPVLHLRHSDPHLRLDVNLPDGATRFDAFSGDLNVLSDGLWLPVPALTVDGGPACDVTGGNVTIERPSGSRWFLVRAENTFGDTGLGGGRPAAGACP